MNSTLSRRQLEEQRQEEIRRQIATLQAQLKDVSNTTASTSTRDDKRESTKRKKHDGPVLAPATPSPKRRRVDEPKSSTNNGLARKPLPSLAAHPSLAKKPVTTPKNPAATISKPAPSNVLSKLASLKPVDDPEALAKPVYRSSGFSEKPTQPRDEDGDKQVSAPERDDRLALIEKLEIGPTEHKPPFDDPHFAKLEPNSGIRLSSRAIPHDELQDYLRGRYYLSPSKLYSVIRLLPNKQGYDVPVEGDWVTIAVVAERGPMRYTRAPVGVGKDDGEDPEEKEDTLDDLPLDGASSSNTRPNDLRKWKGKGKSKDQEPPKPSGKKYINLKLIDFGCRSKSTSATGRQSVIRGDAFLSLLLFEADRVDTYETPEGKKETIYKGGSRGAFEKMSKLKEGAVVALLNPKILKPFQRSNDAPHPTDNILALTPESIDSTLVIGQSLDLGMCQAIKRDGKVCGSWCDKRVSDVCDWHIQRAVERKRAARPEFTAGTSGLSRTAKRKPEYDPQRQWGLKPVDDAGSGGATYVVSGHIVSGRSDPRNMYVNETIGRDAQARAARVSAKEADKELESLLQKDKEGMKYVLSAREYAKKLKKDEEGSGEKNKKGKGTEKKSKAKKDEGKGTGTGKERDSSPSSDSDGTSDDAHGSGDETKKSKHAKHAYSASLIRNLGFDPTGRDLRKTEKVDEVQKKLNALAALHASKREKDLGPRPGKKPSTVRPPTPTTYSQSSGAASSSLIDLDSDDDDLERAERDASGKTLGQSASKGLVSLDSSDED
ncbi:hypothetical protein K474DRAFT_1603813 [Panus rudis PR-1116 ss-1]|nr:hypothetical protein K474DRAFT_1603813 [Panus rudis PR-1116 ss-1]